MKVWLASAAWRSAVVQLFTAAGSTGAALDERRLSQHRASLVGRARLRARAAGRVPLHLPARYQTGTTRSHVHAVPSAFFGAYVAKVTIVRLKALPHMVHPIAGGLSHRL
jgi:hypothetical protein